MGGNGEAAGLADHGTISGLSVEPRPPKAADSFDFRELNELTVQ
jgi:hypothetical protein